MQKKRPRRIMFAKQKALITLLILVLPLAVFAACFGTYTIYRQNEQLSAGARNTLRFYKNAFLADAESASSYLANLLSIDYDFQQLCYSRSALDAHLESYALTQKFKLQIESNPSLGALFIITEENRLYRAAYNVDGYTLQEKDDMLAFLKEAAASDEFYPTRGWIPKTIGKKSFLFRFFGRRGFQTYCVAMLDLSRITAPPKSEEIDTDAFAFFTLDGAEDAAQPLSHAEALAALHIEPENSAAPYYISGRPQQYLIVREALPELGISLGYASPYHGVFSGMDGVQLTLLLLCVILILLIPVCYSLLQRSLFSPLHDMAETIERIGEGDLYAEMEKPYSIQEFESVRLSFNTMVQRIRALKISSYEKELDAKQAKLQYLQLQIRPHFYLNCLKNIYALAEARNYATIQQAILSLSGYLRYIFRDSMKRIPLSEELHSILDYMQLQRLCAASPPQCDLEIDADLEDFRIPPLSLVTFVENSVQHGTTLDHPLHVTVRAAHVKSPGGDYVSLLVINDGPPFSDALLREAAEPAPQIYRSRNVGITNIRYRLRLLYGDAAALTLYNAGGRPCAEVFLPVDDPVSEEDTK